MTKEELIEAAKKKSASEEAVKAFKDRVKKREARFDKESRRQAVDSAFMARSYNL